MSGSVVILSAVLVIWLGILLYLVWLSRKVDRIKRKVHTDES